MTAEPNALTQSIHHKRMPVLMSDPADFETWLSGSTEDAFRPVRFRARGSVEGSIGHQINARMAFDATRAP